MLAIFPFTFLIATASAGNSCRERSSVIRQDGEYCPEVPPWQHQPVELEQHVRRLRARWPPSAARRQDPPLPVLKSSEVTRYLDTVLAPFVDTYHKNMQDSYQQFTKMMITRIHNETTFGVEKKKQVYLELIELADKLEVPAMCDEERRNAHTLANSHVAEIYHCVEVARQDISKFGHYAEEMITITNNHMREVLEDASRVLGDHAKDNSSSPTTVMMSLSHAAVQLGYELDLSLTNARRHHEQSCERLTTCVQRARTEVNEQTSALKENLYYCVYA